MARILIVDDDVELTELLSEFLEPEGFLVNAVHDGAAGLRANPDDFDLIVLDVMLPAVSGFEVLKRLRLRSNVPAIMLTARDGEVDRIVGFEIGADDYVPKPVNPRELAARIRAVLRRTSPNDAGTVPDLTVGEIRLSGASRTAWVGDRRLDLTTAEFNLLQHLLRTAGQIVTREDLSFAAFGRRHLAGADRNVDTLISKLRKKLGPQSDHDDRIKTVRNVGYLYAIPAAPTAEAGQPSAGT